jgi:hypothetical protein
MVVGRNEAVTRASSDAVAKPRDRGISCSQPGPFRNLEATRTVVFYNLWVLP